MLTPDSVNTLKSAISGLGAEQAALALSTRGLTEEQQKQVLVEAGLLSSSERMSASMVSEALTHSTLSKAKQEELLIDIGLMNADTKEIISTNAVTESKLREALAEKGITGAKADTLVASILQTGQNTKEAISWNVLWGSIKKTTAAMIKWLVTNPFGWAILAGVALFGLAKITDALTVSVEEQREKLENLKGEYAEIESELKSLNDELTTTQQRMAELRNKGNLTFTEKEEYDNLVKVNNALQRKIDLLELEEKSKRKEKNKAFVSTMEKDTEDPFEYEVDPDGKSTTGQYSISDTYLTSEIGYIEAQFEIRKQLLDDLSKAETKEEQDRIQERIDEIDKYLQDKSAQWASDMDGIEYIDNPSTEDEKKVNQWLDFINDFQDHMAIAMGGDNAKTNSFNRVVDNWQFDEVVQGLQDLGKEGKVTAEMLDDPKYDAFIQKLYELGVIDSVDNLDAVALAFNNIGTEAENAGESVDEFIVSLSDLEKASDKIKNISSAFNELSDDGYITIKTLSEIQAATGLSGDEWAIYETKLLNAKKGSEEFNQVLSELTYKIIENEFGTIDLVNATEEEIETIEDKIAATLRENGVVNADAVAHGYLVQKKRELEFQNKISNKSIDSVIESLEDETTWCGLTTDAVARLVAQEIIFNTTDLDISDKLEKLQSLYGMLGLVGDKWEQLNNSMNNNDPIVKSGFNIGLGIYKREGENRQYEWVYNDVVYSTEEEAYNAYIADQVNKDFSNTIPNSLPKPIYTNTSSSKDNSPTQEDSADAVVNRINLRSEELKQQEELIQDEIEIAESDNDYEKQISLTNDLITTRKQRVSELGKANTELYKEIENIHNNNPWNEASWFDSLGNATEAYYNDLNSASTKEEQENIKDTFETLSKYHEAYKNNEEEIRDISKDILNDEETISELYSNIHDGVVRNIEHERDMLLNANPNADVTSFYERLQEEYHKEAERLRALDPEKYKEEIQELEQAWWDAEEAKNDYYTNTVFEQYKRYISNITDELQEQADAYDILINKQQTLVDAEEKMYDAQAKVRESQREISKELAVSKALAEYADDDMRKNLFNDEDYKKLDKKLKAISGDIGDINSWYNSQINSLTEDTWYLEEAITKEYERRLASKEREYEIVQAELDLEKKKQELNNILNEKNIRMLVKNENGAYEWTYVHDYEEASQIIGEIAEVEGQIEETRLQAQQDSALAQKQAEVDMLSAEKNAIEKRIELINEETEKLSKAIESITNPLEDFGTIVSTLNTYLTDNLGKDIPSIKGIDLSSNSTNQNNVKSEVDDMLNDALNAGAVVSNSGFLGKQNTSKVYYNGVQIVGSNAEEMIKNKKPFDNGGFVYGKGLLTKDTDLDELVLDPARTEKFINLMKDLDFSQKYFENVVKNIKFPILDSTTDNSKKENYNFSGNIILQGVTDPDGVISAFKNGLSQNSYKRI